MNKYIPSGISLFIFKVRKSVSKNRNYFWQNTLKKKLKKLKKLKSLI